MAFLETSCIVQVIHALLVRADDEVFYTQVQLLPHGMEVVPTAPIDHGTVKFGIDDPTNLMCTPGKHGDDHDDDDEAPPENGYERDTRAAQQNLVEALLKMQLLPRLRYLLEVC